MKWKFEQIKSRQLYILVCIVFECEMAAMSHLIFLSFKFEPAGKVEFGILLPSTAIAYHTIIRLILDEIKKNERIVFIIG